MHILTIVGTSVRQHVRKWIANRFAISKMGWQYQSESAGWVGICSPCMKRAPLPGSATLELPWLIPLVRFFTMAGTVDRPSNTLQWPSGGNGKSPILARGFPSLPCLRTAPGTSPLYRSQHINLRFHYIPTRSPLNHYFTSLTSSSPVTSLYLGAKSPSAE